MRTLGWLGGISLTALLVFGGCSSDNGSPTNPADAGSDATGGGGKVQADGSPGREASAGASGLASDGSAGGGGSADAQVNVSDGSVDSAPTDDATPASDSSAQDAPLDVAQDVPVVLQDAGKDSSQPDANQVPDSATADAPIDVQQVGADVLIPMEAGPDANEGECALGPSGTGQCGMSALIERTTTSFGSPPLAVSVTICPNGANVASHVCVAEADLGGTQWQKVTGQRALEGEVRIRARKIPAQASIATLQYNCDFAVGGNDYERVLVRVTLPSGTSVDGFVPGCTPVSNVQVALRETVKYSVTGDAYCADLATMAENAGALGSLNTVIQDTLAQAFEQRVCIR